MGAAIILVILIFGIFSILYFIIKDLDNREKQLCKREEEVVLNELANLVKNLYIQGEKFTLAHDIYTFYRKSNVSPENLREIETRSIMCLYNILNLLKENLHIIKYELPDLIEDLDLHIYQMSSIYETILKSENSTNSNPKINNLLDFTVDCGLRTDLRYGSPKSRYLRSLEIFIGNLISNSIISAKNN